MNNEFISILDKSKEIHDRKNQDYTSGTNVDENFERVAELTNWFNNSIDKSFASFIAVKLARLASLLNKSNAPNFESIDDTFVDLVTYAGLWGGNVVRRISGPINSHYGLERYNDLRGTPFENIHSIDKCQELGCKDSEFKYIDDPVKVITSKEKKLYELINMYDSLTEDNYRELLSMARIMKSRNK